jgi:hypothetical protein
MSEQAGYGDLGGPAEGLLISDQAGNYYFVRPEFLETCKIPKEEIESLAGANESFREHLPHPRSPKPTVPTPEILGSLKVSRPLRDIDPELAERLRASATNTYMCPW